MPSKRELERRRSLLLLNMKKERKEKSMNEHEFIFSEKLAKQSKKNAMNPKKILVSTIQ